MDQRCGRGKHIELAISFQRYNNLACYYRRAGKLRTALTYLERALALEQKVCIAMPLQFSSHILGTYNNSVAIFHGWSVESLLSVLCRTTRSSHLPSASLHRGQWCGYGPDAFEFVRDIVAARAPRESTLSRPGSLDPHV